jgi:tol-pal system protein YbgF
MKCYAKFGIAVLAASALAGCETTGPTSSNTTGATGSSSEAVRNTVEVQGLREELARLRNEIELQRNQLDKLAERQRNLYDDLDYRLRQQERTAGRGLSLSEPAPGSAGLGTSNTGTGFGAQQPGTTTAPAAGGNVGQLSPDSSRVTNNTVSTGGQGMASVTQGTVAASQPVTGPQAAIATPEEQTAYDEAFNLLKQSRYSESVTAFRQQLARHPGGALADDAQYWIGEAMYVTRDFPNGLTAFETVVNRYPDSARVAEAMLKLGYIQYELGAKEEARQTFTQVVNRFPGSRVAISAQTRLRKLQAEGG